MYSISSNILLIQSRHPPPSMTEAKRMATAAQIHHYYYVCSLGGTKLMFVYITYLLTNSVCVCARAGRTTSPIVSIVSIDAVHIKVWIDR